MSQKISVSFKTSWYIGQKTYDLEDHKALEETAFDMETLIDKALLETYKTDYRELANLVFQEPKLVDMIKHYNEVYPNESVYAAIYSLEFILDGKRHHKPFYETRIYRKEDIKAA